VLTFFRDNAQELVVKRWENLAVPVDELPFTGLEGRTHTISGSGSLVGRTGDIADSVYTYTGDAVLDGDTLTFSIDQEVNNALGEGHIYTTGSFDLASGTGTQTVVDCQGPALLCSGIVIGSTAFYTAQELDASDPDTITWAVDVAVDLGGTFGIADSASRFTAQRP
jgi:2-methylaconitate cis-trans-isomerase PrpF